MYIGVLLSEFNIDCWAPASTSRASLISVQLWRTPRLCRLCHCPMLALFFSCITLGYIWQSLPATLNSFKNIYQHRLTHTGVRCHCNEQTYGIELGEKEKNGSRVVRRKAVSSRLIKVVFLPPRARVMSAPGCC